eukprot:scaffold22432_cov168-Amphora_coffeaeformis.AAC.14
MSEHAASACARHHVHCQISVFSLHQSMVVVRKIKMIGEESSRFVARLRGSAGNKTSCCICIEHHIITTSFFPNRESAISHNIKSFPKKKD